MLCAHTHMEYQVTYTTLTSLSLLPHEHSEKDSAAKANY